VKARLVQEVIKMIIEPIFETQFEYNSFGNRPNRDFHTALKYIGTYMKKSVWVANLDLTWSLNDLTQKKLMQLIFLKVKDPLILNLIKSGLKTKILAINNNPSPSDVLNPLLINIYLDVFDKWIKQVNQNYKKVIELTKKRLDLYPNKCKTKINKYSIQNSYLQKYATIKYVRYGNQALVGINSNEKQAKEIAQLVNYVLKTFLFIALNNTKIKITHISYGISFLNHLWVRKSFLIQQHGKTSLLKKKTIARETFHINIKQVIRELKNKKFCDGKGMPLPCLKYIHLPQSKTNTKINVYVKHLSNYWLLAHNRRQAMAFVSYILRCSTAKLYAAKFKLKTTAAVFKKSGHLLGKPIGNTKKSAIGSIDKNEQIQKIPEIIYNKHFKIPKPEESHIPKKWQPEYLIALKAGAATIEILKYLTKKPERDE